MKIALLDKIFKYSIISGNDRTSAAMAEYFISCCATLFVDDFFIGGNGVFIRQ